MSLSFPFNPSESSLALHDNINIFNFYALFVSLLASTLSKRATLAIKLGGGGPSSGEC